MTDLVFTVNSQTQDLRFGDPATGNLASIHQLGFACHHLVVLPEQRYLYITGNKPVNGVAHAWFMVFDTCMGAVVKELDLGVGFAGQTALPEGGGGTRAYVAVSQAVGQIDTGPDNGTNRIEVLNISDPADPLQLRPAFEVVGAPWGTLHIVWSSQRNKVYTTHRGNGNLYSIDTYAGTLQYETMVRQQPTGLALSRSGLVLYIGRRQAGDIVPYDIQSQAIAAGVPIVLDQGISDSAILLAVDASDRIIATSVQRPHNPPAQPNPNPNPVPGRVYVIDPNAPNPLVPKIVDTQGSRLGQPAPTPDGQRVFVPRGDQNDLVEIDPAPDPPVMAPQTVQVGHLPTDARAVNHIAGQILTADPAQLQMGCSAPQQVMVRAFDACGNERVGVTIRALTTDPNISVLPPTQDTPAQFDVNCQQYGTGTVNFATRDFPFSTVTVNVDCQCLQLYCMTFYSNNPAGDVPNMLGGVIPIHIIHNGLLQGPRIYGDGLHLHGATLGFTMPANFPAKDLIFRYRRHDPTSNRELAKVTHGGYITDVYKTTGALIRDWHDLVCVFDDITSWTFEGGLETRLVQICFWAPPGLE